MTSLDIQEGGKHYLGFKIQPLEFILANALPFIEGCVIKYICRWRLKGGVADLKKARHYIDILIESAEREELQVGREVLAEEVKCEKCEGATTRTFRLFGEDVCFYCYKLFDPTFQGIYGGTD